MIGRILAAIAVWSVLAASGAVAGDAGRPSVAVAASAEIRGGGAVLEFSLSRLVPYRLFTLDDPARLVVDFKGASAIRGQAASAVGRRLKSVRAGISPDGAWARFVAGLGRPYGISSAEMLPAKGSTAGRLRVVLRPVGRIEFAAKSRRVTDDGRELTATVGKTATDGLLIVALDPGHGGRDPGAVRDGITEKEIALAFALDLRKKLMKTGRYRVLLTRNGDEFVPLGERVRRSRAAAADLMISIHLNTIEKGRASGAAIYTLGSAGSDREAAEFARHENGADSLAGAISGDTETDIVRILSDMASTETATRSERLAGRIVEGLKNSVGVLRSHPIRRAALRVLRAPDLPAVLLELGFLSDKRDRANMTSAEWRSRAAGGIVSALDAWAANDAESSRLARQ